MARFSRSSRSGASADLLVVGLGNPGAEFEGTRHNAGADVVALLAARSGERLRSEKGTRSLVAKLRWDELEVFAAVPQTYMNDSGLAVVALVRRFSVKNLERLVVVHDELDLPVGKVRIKAGGGTAGHYGLESINAHLHDSGYTRVRIGIGKPPGGSHTGSDHVLRRPARADRESLEAAIELAADATEFIAKSGVAAAMNVFNSNGHK